MKTIFGLFMAAALVSTFAPSASAGPLVSRPSEYEKPCLEKGDANRCFELGYKFMRDKGKNSKKLARYYFQVGCAAKAQRACTPGEAKLAARDFTDTNRAVASSQKQNTPKLNATSSASVAPSAPMPRPPTKFRK